VSNPDATKAAIPADGPGMGTTLSPSLTTAATTFDPGSLIPGVPASLINPIAFKISGHLIRLINRYLSSLDPPLDLVHSGCFVVGMTGNEWSLDVQGVEEFDRVSGVLCIDAGHAPQHADASESNVSQVAQRSGHDIEPLLQESRRSLADFERYLRLLRSETEWPRVEEGFVCAWYRGGLTYIRSRSKHVVLLNLWTGVLIGKESLSHYLVNGSMFSALCHRLGLNSRRYEVEWDLGCKCLYWWMRLVDQPRAMDL